MYLNPRVIPVLSMQNGDLVKTIQFKSPRYIGDPINTVKIFNDKGADELCILDITASRENKEPDFIKLEEIANEAFMPLSYGGGIATIEQVRKIIRMGYEKIVFNTSFFTNQDLIKDTVEFLGSSGVVICLDVKKDMLGKYRFLISDGQSKVNFSTAEVVKLLKELNVGEVIINSINHDGMMNGYDLEILKEFEEQLSIPVIPLGGASNKDDLIKAINAGASAVAASSIFIYYGTKKAVLISYYGL